MALSITAANVLKGTGNRVIAATAGGTVTQGMPVYKDAADANAIKACQATTLVKSECVGIALNAASDGQPIDYQTEGQINLGATLSKGEVYCVDDAVAGGIVLLADIETGATDYVTILGIAISSSLLEINIQIGGVVRT